MNSGRRNRMKTTAQNTVWSDQPKRESPFSSAHAHHPKNAPPRHPGAHQPRNAIAASCRASGEERHD
jgi:hypothetical protein